MAKIRVVIDWFFDHRVPSIGYPGWHGKAVNVLCVENTGSELFYQYRPQGFLKMADDRTGSMREVCSGLLCQTMNGFFCGYRLIID